MKELPCSNNEPEPKVNILAWQEDEKQIILIIPRCKHRPECYSAEAGKQMLVSPGTLDMAGIIVTPRKEDFEKISTEDIRQILQEVGLPREDAQEIIKKYRKETDYDERARNKCRNSKCTRNPFFVERPFLPKEKPYVANKASLSVKEAFCGTAICIVS